MPPFSPGLRRLAGWRSSGVAEIRQAVGWCVGRVSIRILHALVGIHIHLTGDERTSRFEAGDQEIPKGSI